MTYAYNTRDFAGQGVLRVGYKDPVTGLPLGLMDVGNCTALSIGNSVERRVKREMRTGQQQRVRNNVRSVDYTANFTIDSVAKEVLEVIYNGTGTDVAGATVTAQAITAYRGKAFFLGRVNLTSFTSLTNSGATTTYVNGTDYKVNLSSGVIEIPAGSAITDGQSVRANYVCGAHEKFAAATESINRPLWLFFEGLNTAEEDAPYVVEVFSVQIQPPSEFQLIQEDGFTSFEVQGEVNYDDRFLADGGIYRSFALQA